MKIHDPYATGQLRETQRASGRLRVRPQPKEAFNLEEGYRRLQAADGASRVGELKEAIAAGRYAVDIERLARALVEKGLP